MKPNLPAAHLEAWRRHYVSFWRVCNAVEADLQAAGLPSLGWYDALYELYAQVMDYKRRRAELSGWKLAMAWGFVVYAYYRDMRFNFTTATAIFNDPAKELTVTARLKRYRKAGTQKQQALAEFLCDQVLDKGDPDGNHC